MKLVLSKLSPITKGIYTIHKIPNRLPDRMLALHPDAAFAFNKLEKDTGGLIYSDIYRSASESLVAMQQKRGVQSPSFSAHNYGLAFDLDIDGVMKAQKWTLKQLCETLENYGWFCFRRDHSKGSEIWHFNYLSVNSAQKYLVNASSWTEVAELRIRDIYGHTFALKDTEIQESLKKLGLYSGEIDGDIGPLSIAAIHTFQRAWKLKEGPADPITKRVLAFVSAEKVYV